MALRSVVVRYSTQNRHPHQIRACGQTSHAIKGVDGNSGRLGTVTHFPILVSVGPLKGREMGDCPESPHRVAGGAVPGYEEPKRFGALTVPA
jgi:hypothetical protein